jgi:hypothetical protein
MREILSKSLTLRGLINYDFAEKHYSAFLREVGASGPDCVAYDSATRAISLVSSAAIWALRRRIVRAAPPVAV